MPYAVDHTALRTRRLERRRSAPDKRDWSQEAVALKAGVDRRTYGDMERNPGQRFDYDVITWVCTVLGLDPATIAAIPAPGDILLDGPVKVDFRPAREPGAPQWGESRIIPALDRLGFHTRDGVTATYTLRSIALHLPQLAGEERFECHFLSNLTQGGQGHLGIEADFTPQSLGPGAHLLPRAWSFKSRGGYGLTWEQFHERVRVLGENVLRVETAFVFDHETIEKTFRLSIAELHSYMKEKERIGQKMFKFVQLEVLTL